ncbi:glycosyltransferase [Lewinella sp. JB7]|uniref:glycosyltransferase n=1 Tax=Lewinella sp. JB7 TaxID=2962887 RepID=UPI0020C9598A|nr:glycosyltransferase [Lewinella sp. JB7]MCP9236582.1 hypothetical protein [Lewinella sp. JB7]
MPRPIAFYVHHHGGGHANRTRLLADHLPTTTPVHAFTSSPDRFIGWDRGIVHPLPPDVDPDRDPAADLLVDQVLHYAPLDLPCLQERMAKLAGWITRERPAWFIVDLSVEIALFIRLCGVRVALVRLHGHREDPAHLAAFRLADRLLAPFPPELEDAHTPAWVRAKTTYLGTFSRFDERRETREACRRLLHLDEDRKVVTVINGLGGGAREPAYWERAARANHDWYFLLVGKVVPTGTELPNLRVVGLVDDTFPYLRAADVVVGSGGTNTMMEIGAVRVPFVSQPEPRPFDEQECKMEALQRLGLTEIARSATAPAEWGRILDRALRQDVSGWEGLGGGGSLAAKLADLFAR